MSDFTITLTLGDRWSQTFDSAALEDPAALLASGAVAMSGLRASWTMSGELLPSQPSPVTTTLSLYVPDAAAFPAPEDGEHFSVVLIPAGLDATTGEYLVPFETYGRVSDVTAVPLRDGLRFDLVVVDYLAELGEETQTGDFNTLADSGVYWWERWNAIAARSRYPIAARAATGGYSIEVNARAGGNPATTLQLLEEVLVDSVTWYNASNNVIDPSDPVRLPDSRWERYTVAYNYQGPDAPYTVLQGPRDVSYGTGLMTSYVLGANDFPYRLAIAADLTVDLELRTEPAVYNNAHGDGSQVQVIDGAAVQLPSLQWRQTRRTTPNSVRLAGEFTQGDVGSGPVVQEVTRRNEAEVDRRGLVEAAGQSQAFFEAYGWAIALAYLGDAYRQAPRFSLDQVVVMPELIDDWRRWPYFFPTLSRSIGSAYGCVFITGIPSARNLYRRAEFPARLIGADLELDGGRLTITGHLRHDVPFNQAGGLGNPEELTAASLGADTRGAQLTPADFGELTAADLRLVARPLTA